jgi:hypothetical protein
MMRSSLQHARTRLLPAAAALSAVALGGALLSPVDPAGAAEPVKRTTVSEYDRPAWAAEWMVRNTSYTQASAVAVAKKYDVIAAMSSTFQKFAPAMRKANPDLVLLAYVNGPFAAKWKPPYPESWYAHTAGGARVKARRFGNYLMNVHTRQWKDEAVAICRYEKQRSGYDGCFLDSMGNGILTTKYLTGMPVDPRTRKTWTKMQWIKDTAAVADHVRSKTGWTVATNGLGSGLRYFADGGTHLVAGSDLSMAEGWLRHPTAGADEFPSESVWKKSVDMIADSETMGTGMLAVTKLWTPMTAGQRQRWYEYTMGSFLLGTNGRSRMFFLQDGCAPPCSKSQEASPLASQPSPAVEVGAPQGRYTRITAGAFTRTFGRGYVAVNPTASAVTVTLPAGAWVRLNGSRVSGKVSLGADRGLVLKKA